MPKETTVGLIPPLSDEFFLALGRVTALFAVLEGQLEFLTWSLISRDQRLGQIVTAELPFKGVVALLSSIFRHRVDDERLREDLDAILSRAMAVEQQRNKVTHSMWAVGDTPEMRARIKTTAKKGKGIRHEFEQMRASDIEAIATKASTVALELQQFSLRLPAELVGRIEVTVGDGVVAVRVPPADAKKTP